MCSMKGKVTRMNVKTCLFCYSQFEKKIHAVYVI
jgi:hypothetical protein